MTGPPVRAPRYLGRFRCIGAACEDHCCGGWGGIDVDPPTAETYRTLVGRGDRRAVSLDLLQQLEPNPDAWPDQRGEAALIPLTPGMTCPFFNAERLCAIQGALGEALRLLGLPVDRTVDAPMLASAYRDAARNAHPDAAAPDERDAQTARGRVESDAGAGDAAAEDKQVESAVG